ncbi:MAG: hypothetical protein E7628_05790 [Ruminococcaceae bacterium]|nr:hypothetical protein [Oscillospiraceae bacterium]
MQIAIVFVRFACEFYEDFDILFATRILSHIKHGYTFAFSTTRGGIYSLTQVPKGERYEHPCVPHEQCSTSYYFRDNGDKDERTIMAEGAKNKKFTYFFAIYIDFFAALSYNNMVD